MDREEIFLSSAVTFVPEKSCLTSREQGDIHLTPNERRLLELIISGKCKKETIFEEIWHSQGTIVSESSYHQLIKMLRRKLQFAGLPGSIIKTIPRYGLVLVPEATPEAAVGDATESECDAAEPHPDCVPSGLPEEPAAASLAPANKLANRLLLGVCLALIVLPPAIVPAMREAPRAFQESMVINGVTFHFSSRRSIDRSVLEQKLREVPAGINNVYIATNGPKVFVAQCEGELSKEGKCNYDYYSSY
ncbi:transcriptional regulator [Enterobacteriaceae bacterium C34A]